MVHAGEPFIIHQLAAILARSCETEEGVNVATARETTLSRLPKESNLYTRPSGIIIVETARVHVPNLGAG